MKRTTFGATSSISRRAILAGAVAISASACSSASRPRGTAAELRPANTELIELLTTAGSIRIEVYVERAPKVAAWFLSQVDAKSLDGTKFFRSGHLQGQPPRPRFLEGGALSPFLLGEKGQKPATAAAAGLPVLYDWETTAVSGLRHLRGSVSLARDITGQGGVLPDLVIALETVAEMDAGGGYSPQNTGFPVFGQVVSGMDNVDAIAGQPRAGKTYVPFLNGQILSEPVQIKRIIRLKAGRDGTS